MQWAFSSLNQIHHLEAQKIWSCDEHSYSLILELHFKIADFALVFFSSSYFGAQKWGFSIHLIQSCVFMLVCGLGVAYPRINLVVVPKRSLTLVQLSYCEFGVWVFACWVVVLTQAFPVSSVGSCPKLIQTKKKNLCDY